MTELIAGREPVQIVEIVQPYCNNTHGTAPCTAAETGDRKCFNTRSTCNDPANFDKGSLRLFFSKGNVADRLDIGYLTTTDKAIVTTESGEPIEVDNVKGPQPTSYRRLCLSLPVPPELIWLAPTQTHKDLVTEQCA